MRKVLFITAVIAMALVLWTPQVWAAGTPVNTSISNQAYADYEDANGNARPRVTSNTVTTVVSQVAAISSSPATATSNGVPGTNVEYAATICNNGNGSDTITLAALNDLGWTVTIYHDTNGNGVLDAGEDAAPVATTGSLAADACFNVIVVVTVPAAAPNGTLGTTTLTATSTFNGTVSDTSVFTTDVEAAVLHIVKTATPANPQPGDTVTYAITGTNSGGYAYSIRVIDAIPANTTYVPESMRAGSVGGDYASAAPLTDANDAENLSYTVGADTAVANAYYNSGSNQLQLDWSQCLPAGVFYFQVTVNSNVASGTGITNTATATYGLLDNGLRPYTETSNGSTVNVATAPGVSLDPDRAGTGDPGDQMVYAFTVQNTGNAPDTFDFTYTSSAGWTWVIWKDVDGNGIPGTDGDYTLTDTGLLDALESVTLLAVATIPAGLADGAVDTAVITGKSRIDTSASDTVTFTTTVTAPVLTIAKAVSPAGNQPPGTILTYTATVTNTGTGVATSVIISDMVPTYTTYVAGSIRTGATSGTLTARTDAADGDGGRFDSGANAVMAGGSGSLSLGPGATWILEFKVTID
ncbi:MAG: DUF11 domain-containing protein [Syntrophales bacterium]|jgi:uncharacterized repeat protein (TIGR01451 family)|nr:DUF11 domain-containing protein [Syntrophales bacterium]MDY0044865.1 DUF11 domain-containing protein [Syntrophales bacterium]